MSRIRIIKNDSYIYLQDDDNNDEVYIVSKGRVKLTTAYDNTEDSVLSLEEGNIIGLQSAIIGYKRLETFQAMANSELVVFSTEEFVKILYTDSSILLTIFKTFSNKLRESLSNSAKFFIKKSDTSNTNPDSMSHSSENNEDNLYNLGRFFHLNNRSYYKYVFDKYKEYYPNGKYISQINKFF